MSNRKATVGLDDIAWGEGFIDIPVYGGGTRKAKRVNARDIPYSALKTLGQKLDEFETLMSSDAFSSIHTHINDISRISTYLAQVYRVFEQLDDIQRLALSADSIDAVQAVLPLFSEIEPALDKVNKVSSQMDYIMCRITKDKQSISDQIGYVQKLIEGKAEPMMVELLEVKALLDNKVATAVNEIVQGCENAKKWGSYELKIESKRFCYTPKVVVDDDAKTITWQVPTVKGECTVVEVEGSINADEVSALIAEYIATHNITGDNNEDITVDDLEPSSTTFTLRIEVANDRNGQGQIVIDDGHEYSKTIDAPLAGTFILIEGLKIGDTFNVNPVNTGVLSTTITKGETPFYASVDNMVNKVYTIEYDYYLVL